MQRFAGTRGSGFRVERAGPAGLAAYARLSSEKSPEADGVITRRREESRHEPGGEDSKELRERCTAISPNHGENASSSRRSAKQDTPRVVQARSNVLSLSGPRVTPPQGILRDLRFFDDTKFEVVRSFRERISVQLEGSLFLFRVKSFQILATVVFDTLEKCILYGKVYFTRYLKFVDTVTNLNLL